MLLHISKSSSIYHNPPILNFIKRFFQKINFDGNVSYTTNGVSGLIKLGSSKPNIIILDIEMPGMNGIEVCKKILANPTLSDIKIVIISGYLSKYEEELKSLNIEVMIEKPFKYTDLEKKLLPLLI